MKLSPFLKLPQLIFGFSALAFASGASLPAHAATLVVSSLDDSGDGSLRAQVQTANSSSEPDTILFDAGLQGAVSLTSPLNISSDVTIRGPVDRPIHISGGNATRLFTVENAGRLNLLYLTLRDGNYTAPKGKDGENAPSTNTTANQGGYGLTGETAYGGAIYNKGALQIWNCLLHNNQVVGGRGGTGGNGGNALVSGRGGNGGPGGNGGNAYGGAIYNQGTASATLVNTTLVNNRMIAGAGGIVGTPGTGPAGNGGVPIATIPGVTKGSAIGCDLTAKLRMVHCTLSGNTGAYSDFIQAPTDYSLKNSLTGNGTIASTSNITRDANGNSLNAGRAIAALSDNGGPTQTCPILANEFADNTRNGGKPEFLPADEFDLDNDGNVTEPLPCDARGPGFARVAGYGLNCGAYQDPSHFYVMGLTLRPDQVRVNSKVDATAIMSNMGGLYLNDKYTFSFVWKIGDEIVQTASGTSGYDALDLSRKTQDVRGATLTCQVTVTSQLTGTTSTRITSTVLQEMGSLVVNTNSDTSTGTDGLTSLREALNFVSNGYVGSSPAITFALGSQEPVIQLTNTLSVGSSFYGSSSPFTVSISASEPVTIQGKEHPDMGGALEQPSALFPLLRSSFNLSLDNLIFKHGRAEFLSYYHDGGGAVKATGALTARRCRFEDNRASSYGGAIYVASNSPFASPPSASLENCVFVNNSAESGGAISIGSDFGFYPLPTLSLSGCTFDRNTASSIGGAVRFSGQSGSIYNCTFSGNSSTYAGSATSPSQVCGGALFSNRPLSVVNSTFANNSAPFGGGAIAQFGSTLTLLNNLFAANTTGTNTFPTLFTPPNQTTTVTDLGFNLVEVGQEGAQAPLPFSASSNITSTNVRLGALRNNGGLVPTMTLQGGSPALNAGANTTIAPYSLTTDARGAGFPRKYGSGVDIGAVEVQTAPPVIASVEIAPLEVRTNDSLEVTQSSSDPDGDTLSLSYQWKKNGEAIPNATGTTLDLSKAGNGDKGDTLSCVVTANDGKGGISARESAVVTVQNSLPVLSTVNIAHSTPKTDDVLSLVAPTLTDADNETPVLTYKWKNNGQVLAEQTGATLDLAQEGNGDHGDTISVIVTASDATDSTSKESNEVVVENSAPELSNVSIDNQSPTTKKTLTATASVTDKDEDAFTLSYAWKKNGVALEEANDSTLDLSVAGNGDEDDKISVVVTADDKHGGTTSKESAAVTIRATSLPSLTLSQNSVVENSAAGTLVGTLSTTGQDSGATFTYALVGGEGDTNNDSFQVVGNELRTKGTFDFETQKSYSVRVHSIDENELEIAVPFSISVTNINEAPTALVTLSPSTPSTNTQLQANATGQDPEGAEVSLSYVWKKNGKIIANEEEATLELSKAGNGDQGDRIMVVVTADDKHGGTSSTESEEVVVKASASVGLTLSATTIAENQPSGTNIGTFSTTDVDADDTFSYSLVEGEGDEDNAAFRISGDVLIAASSFNFEARSRYSIRVNSTDGNGQSVGTSFIIAITNVNEVPTATVAISPSSPTTNLILQANAKGTDADGDTVSFTYIWKKNDVVLAGEATSTLNLAGAGYGDKNDRVSVEAVPSDGLRSGPGASATVTVANSAPVLTGKVFAGRENQSLSSQVVGSDVDKEALTYNVQSLPRFGTLTLQNSGAFTYAPKVNWNGSDSFAVRVVDGSGASATATFSLNIAAVNGVPVAMTDVVKGTEDVPLSIPASTLLYNDRNGENVGEADALRVIKVAGQSGFPGTLAFDLVKQTIVFTPKLNWNGTTTFTYTVQDSKGATATAQVTLQIAPVNDAPVAVPAQMTVISGTLGEISIGGSDVEGDALAFALSAKPLNGFATVVKVGDKWLLRYQSKVGFSGTDTLTFIARDGKLNSIPATVTITVKANNAPLLLSLLPNRGTFPAGSTVVFEQKVRDADGTSHLDAAAFLIGNSATAANARGGATLWFDAQSNLFTLTKDDGTSTFAPVALGGSLENSQVSVTLGTSDVRRETNGILTLRWRITFKPGFVGTKSLWSRAEDMGSLSAGFTKSGDITLQTPIRGLQAAPSGSAPTS